MGTHPNAILMVVLTPDELSRKTMRDILGNDYERDGNSIVIDDLGGHDYHSLIMEDSFDEGFQIAANEGDLVFFKFITYGYGDAIVWKELESVKYQLEQWAQKICKEHHCSYSIQITANYW
jgi:hypothetical protein